MFEILAFQSDISFWKTQSKHVGISLRTVIISLLSQIIVFLFLLINDTSMLIIVPAFIGILIQIWKVSVRIAIPWAVIDHMHTQINRLAKHVDCL